MLDMNVPKLTTNDQNLFKNLVEDLFPGISQPIVDYSQVCDTFVHARTAI
jgi:hypothetical protein